MGSRLSKPMSLTLATNDRRLKDGKNLLLILWKTIAEKVIQEAIRVYELSPEQAAAIKAAFGRVPYSVEVE
jgi:hypothetical protein